MRRYVLVGSLGALLCASCGTKEDEGSDDSWGGSDPHLRVTGTVDGKSVDFELEGEAAASVTNLGCQREYVMPGPLERAAARHTELELSALVEVEGEIGSIQFEFKRHDLSADPMGTAIRVVPRVDGETPATDAMWIDFEMNNAADERLLEISAESGTFNLREWTGEPEADSPVIPDGGTVGATATAVFGVGNELQVSFTANCVASEVDPQ